MNKKKTGFFKKIKILIVPACLVVVFALPLKIFAIGQITEPITIKNAQRGQEPQAILTVINNEEEETEIGLLAKGDIASWVRFYLPDDLKNAIQNVKMKAGTQEKIIARFGIPNDARNGKYAGYVTISKKPADSTVKKEESGVSISQQIDREVTIEISGKETVSFEVSVIPQTYDLKKDELLSIRLIYDNRGNVSITPQAQIKIKKGDQAVYNAIHPYPENQPPIRPGEIYEIPAIEIPTNKFENGNYSAEMSFMENGKAIIEKNFGFSSGIVIESAANADLGGAAGQKNIFNGDLKFSWVLMGMMIIAITLIFFKTKKSKSGNSKNEKP